MLTTAAGTEGELVLFFDELDSVLCDRPTTQPLVSYDSAAPENEEGDNEDEGNCKRECLLACYLTILLAGYILLKHIIL